MRNRKFYKRGVNKPENSFEIMLTDKAKLFSRRGYPDYIIMRDGKILGFVEVKPRVAKELKPSQKLFAEFCIEHGIPFSRWSPDEPFPEWI